MFGTSVAPSVFAMGDDARDEMSGWAAKKSGAREGNLIKTARCLAEISLMKTFVRRASGAELSADFTEKETNERASVRTSAFTLPFFRLRDKFPTVFANIP